MSRLRRLNDGSQYRVVKVMYEPDELQSLIRAEGWRADIDATRRFIFGSIDTGPTESRPRLRTT
jgi:demethylmenaquinone methyltransferase/2-methoxy-6-polyprenyl-1,4-benzoquinol methylase